MSRIEQLTSVAHDRASFRAPLPDWIQNGINLVDGITAAYQKMNAGREQIQRSDLSLPDDFTVTATTVFERRPGHRKPIPHTDQAFGPEESLQAVGVWNDVAILVRSDDPDNPFARPISEADAQWLGAEVSRLGTLELLQLPPELQRIIRNASRRKPRVRR